MSDQLADMALARCKTILNTANLFYRARWSQVAEGDIVLIAEDSFIHEARVVEIRKYDFEGRPCIKATLNPVGSERRFISAFWPATTVHIQSRF